MIIKIKIDHYDHRSVAQAIYDKVTTLELMSKLHNWDVTKLPAVLLADPEYQIIKRQYGADPYSAPFHTIEELRAAHPKLRYAYKVIVGLGQTKEGTSGYASPLRRFRFRLSRTPNSTPSVTHASRLVEREITIDTDDYRSIAQAIRDKITTPELMAAINGWNLIDDSIVQPGWYADDGNKESYHKSAHDGAEAAQDYVKGGDWDDVGGAVQMRVWRKGIDSDGDQTQVEVEHHLIDLPVDENVLVKDVAISDRSFDSRDAYISALKERLVVLRQGLGEYEHETANEVIKKELGVDVAQGWDNVGNTHKSTDDDIDAIIDSIQLRIAFVGSLKSYLIDLWDGLSQHEYEAANEAIEKELGVDVTQGWKNVAYTRKTTDDQVDEIIKRIEADIIELMRPVENDDVADSSPSRG